MLDICLFCYIIVQVALILEMRKSFLLKVYIPNNQMWFAPKVRS